MTVKSALQSAAVRLVGTKPTAFFSSTDKLSVELADLVNEVSQDIVKAHEWRALATLATVSGDDATELHDFPSDYDRMLTKGEVWSTSWAGLPFSRAKDLDEWYDIKSFSSSGAPGWWIILQGKMNIYPVLATGVDAEFYYISNKFAQDTNSLPIAVFSADTDTFKLPERLLTLGVIWRWRAQKRLEYAEDIRNYELALAKYITDDKGSNIIAVGTRSPRGNVGAAWPESITA